jgi:hypothetical protein
MAVAKTQYTDDGTGSSATAAGGRERRRGSVRWGTEYKEEIDGDGDGVEDGAEKPHTPTVRAAGRPVVKRVKVSHTS